MNEGFDIVPEATSEKFRIPRSVPFIMLRLNGASYVNKKAADLLGLKNGETLRFFRKASADNEWFIGNDPAEGAPVFHSGNLYKFSAVPTIRKIFQALGVTGKKAFFILTSEVEPIPHPKNPEQTGLFVKPKPVNPE